MLKLLADLYGWISVHRFRILVVEVLDKEVDSNLSRESMSVKLLKLNNIFIKCIHFS